MGEHKHNRIFNAVGGILLVCIVVFIMFVNRLNTQTRQEVEERNAKIESFKKQSDSINNALDSLMKKNFESSERFYPPVFDKAFADTCMEDVAVYDNEKEKVVRYIPPYAESICIKHITENKVVVKFYSGFNRGDSGFVFSVTTDTLIKRSDEIIHREVNILESDIYKKVQRTHQPNDFFALTVKYLQLSFQEEKYIDSLIKIGYRDNYDGIPMIPYTTAKSIIAFSSLTDTSKRKEFNKQRSEMMYHAKRGALKEQKRVTFPKGIYKE